MREVTIATISYWSCVIGLVARQRDNALFVTSERAITQITDNCIPDKGILCEINLEQGLTFNFE